MNRGLGQTSQSVTVRDTELECLVSDNIENNNVVFVSEQTKCYKVSPDNDYDEEILEHDDTGHRLSPDDDTCHRVSPADSGCATSLEILSTSCRSPVTALPSLNSLIREETEQSIDDNQNDDEDIKHRLQSKV